MNILQAALRAAAAENASHNHAIRGGVIDALRLEAEVFRNLSCTFYCYLSMVTV